MCGGGSAPAAPDPWAVSAAQTGSNILTADAQSNLNAVGQYNPYGSSTFLENSNGDPYAEISSLTPQLSSILGGQEGIASGLQGVEGALGQSLPTGGVNTDFGAQTNAAEAGAFAQSMGLLNPEFNLQDQNLNTTLTDRGLPVGSEAWNNATLSQNLGQDAASVSAAGQALTAGNAEQAQLFGENLSANQLPYQELSQVIGMNPASGLLGSVPNASTSTTSIQPTNVSQNVYSSYQDQLNEYNAQMNAMIQGGLGAGMLGYAVLSDENEKENRKPADGEDILAIFSKLPVDHYDYKERAQEKYGVPEHRTGPMAQDWAEHFGGDGHSIDLADMAGKMLAAIQALEERTAHLKAA
jgi:hypothetical protein